MLGTHKADDTYDDNKTRTSTKRQVYDTLREFFYLYGYITHYYYYYVYCEVMIFYKKKTVKYAFIIFV